MSEPRPYAVIDLGTNSLRILVAAQQEKNLNIVYNAGVVTRIGAGLGKTGRISSASLQKTLRELLGFKQVCERLHVRKILLAGTSALREAANTAECTSIIKKQTGLALSILTELEEAYYSYHGGLYGISVIPSSPVLVDAGGGSTEFIWAEPGKNLQMVSQPIGALRFTERFIQHDPPAKTELDDMDRHIQSHLQTLPHISGKILVGVGGTITTLAAVILKLPVYDPHIIHGASFSLNEIELCFRQLVHMPFKKRENLPGMETSRADIIIGGAAIMTNAIKYLGFNSIVVSDTGLRYGLMLRMTGSLPPFTSGTQSNSTE